MPDRLSDPPQQVRHDALKLIFIRYRRKENRGATGRRTQAQPAQAERALLMAEPAAAS